MIRSPAQTEDPSKRTAEQPESAKKKKEVQKTGMHQLPIELQEKILIDALEKSKGFLEQYAASSKGAYVQVFDLAHQISDSVANQALRFNPILGGDRSTPAPPKYSPDLLKRANRYLMQVRPPHPRESAQKTLCSGMSDVDKAAALESLYLAHPNIPFLKSLFDQFIYSRPEITPLYIEQILQGRIEMRRSHVIEICMRIPEFSARCRDYFFQRWQNDRNNLGIIDDVLKISDAIFIGLLETPQAQSRFIEPIMQHLLDSGVAAAPPRASVQTSTLRRFISYEYLRYKENLVSATFDAFVSASTHGDSANMPAPPELFYDLFSSLADKHLQQKNPALAAGLYVKSLRNIRDIREREETCLTFVKLVRLYTQEAGAVISCSTEIAAQLDKLHLALCDPYHANDWPHPGWIRPIHDAGRLLWEAGHEKQALQCLGPDFLVHPGMANDEIVQVARSYIKKFEHFGHALIYWANALHVGLNKDQATLVINEVIAHRKKFSGRASLKASRLSYPARGDIVPLIDLAMSSSKLQPEPSAAPGLLRRFGF
jgi:hypothetical protein